jgi:flagellar basal-body rod protein FlgG
VETAASGNPGINTPGTNGSSMLTQGYMETSDANVAEELVNMIQNQRAYQINSTAITTSDQMLQKMTRL